MEINYRWEQDPVAMSTIEHDLWNQRLGRYFPLRPSLVAQQLIEVGQLLPTYMIVAETHTGPCAYICYRVSNTANSEAWIHSVVTRKEYEGQGIGSKLLLSAQAHLEQLGVKELALGGDPGHLLPGLPTLPDNKAVVSWFENRGFHHGSEVFDVCANLSEEDTIRKIARCLKRSIPERFSTQSAHESDRLALVRFVQEQFPGRWVENLYAYLRHNDIRDIIIIKQEETSAIVGFALTYDDSSKWIGPSVYWQKSDVQHYGGLGPIGVHTSVRGKGVGLRLLAEAAEYIRKKGTTMMTIDWTTLAEFYGKCGFVKCQSYLTRSKTLVP